MRRRRARLGGLPLVLALAACASGAATGQAGPGPGAGAARGWTRIDPGGETMCARGTPYAFWARRAEPERLLVFFQGGGGCWDAETCRPGSDFLKDAVSRDEDPTGKPGVFDLENPGNPFRGWSMLFVPYCTGDVHWGDHVRTYDDSSAAARREGWSRVTMRHKGYVNARAALAWAYEQVPDPERVLVSGCSAGSVASILFTPYVIREYPDARVAQLGDAEAFVFDRPVDLQTDYRAHDNFPSWIPALRAIPAGEFTMERFYSAVAASHPEAVFAQYTTAHDSVQIRYYEAVAESRDSADSHAATAASPSWEQALEASLEAIHARAPNFRSFVAAGHEHCATPTRRFYDESVGGTRLAEWVADLAEGRPVEDVRCARCD
ncbi:MAG: pectin acetylesterase-family hydrolase [Gemmatimonadota bacterium]